MAVLQLERFSRKDIAQFVRYFIGGTSYFWAGYIVFSICYGGLHWQWWPAKMLADAVGWSLNYLLQRYWAFNNSSLAKHETSIAEKYIVITILNFGLDYLLVGGLKAIGISPYAGLVISAGFFTAWNYIWYRFWVFFSKSA